MCERKNIILGILNFIFIFLKFKILSIMLKKQFLKKKSLCKVTFVLPAKACKAATSVKLVGDFNEWNTEAAVELKGLKTGDFKAVVSLKTGKDYQFRYLIDGEKWENDWEADEYVTNEHGTENSVVVLSEALAN
jgi:1,4-alpha-glucan branching enzyme